MAHCRFATARQRDMKDHSGEWRKAPIGVKGVIVPSEKGGSTGSQSVENECKLTKIKTAVNLYQNQDPTMKVVR